MDRTEVHFDEIEKMTRALENEEGMIEELLSKVRFQADLLGTAGWVGRGADRFFDEMYQELLPALKRLSEALGDTSIHLKKISNIYQSAQISATGEFDKLWDHASQLNLLR